MYIESSTQMLTVANCFSVCFLCSCQYTCAIKPHHEAFCYNAIDGDYSSAYDVGFLVTLNE